MENIKSELSDRAIVEWGNNKLYIAGTFSNIDGQMYTVLSRRDAYALLQFLVFRIMDEIVEKSNE